MIRLTPHQLPSVKCKCATGLLGALLLVLAFLPLKPVGAEQPDVESAYEPWFFIVMADIQLGVTSQNRNFELEEKNFRRAIKVANRLEPDFVVICGDLVNRPGDPEQIHAIQRLMKEFSGEFPVHLAAGNHDVTGKPTPQTLAAYRETFGPDRYTFDNRGARFLVLNSNVLMKGSEVEDEVETQFRWVKQQLNKAEREGMHPIFVVQHHPWFLKSAEERNRPGFTINRETRQQYLDIFEQHGVLATFAGHAHGNIIGRDRGMQMITTASIATPRSGEPPGIRIVRVFEDRIEHDYYGLRNAPASVDLTQGATAN